MGSKWQPGQSGNPKGRPPGTGEVSKLRARIASQVPEILQKLGELAKGGDVPAAKLLLERVLPPVKPLEAPVVLSLMEGGLANQARQTFAAAANGEVAPGQAAALINSIAAVARVAETEELEKRIERLEQVASLGLPK